MQLNGHIDKMQTSLSGSLAQYRLLFDDKQVDMNSLVGVPIELSFNKIIQCANCRRITPKSYDKQIIRDYLETLDWNKKPPAPRLPDNVMAKAAEKYRKVQTILCN